MRAAKWFGAGDVRVVETSTREPGGAEVVVRVAYCGLCGSDLHEYLDGPHSIPTSEPHPESGRHAPLVLGHEFSGTVVATGDRVARVRVGDRVAVEPMYRCGECARCRAGEYNLCRHFGFAGLMGDGGLAEYTTVPEYMLHPLPAFVSLRQAALFEPAAVALHALRRADFGMGETIVVFGLGPIGLLTVLLAARIGARRIIGVERLPARRALARCLGAHDVVGSTADPPARIRELIGDRAVDVGVEAAGAAGTFRDCLRTVRRGGRVVLLGLGATVRVDASELVTNEQSIISSVGYRNVFGELVSQTQRGMDLRPVVSSVIGLDELVPHGLEQLRTGRAGAKVLVRPTHENT